MTISLAEFCAALCKAAAQAIEDNYEEGVKNAADSALECAELIGDEALTYVIRSYRDGEYPDNETPAQAWRRAALFAHDPNYKYNPPQE